MTVISQREPQVEAVPYIPPALRIHEPFLAQRGFLNSSPEMRIGSPSKSVSLNWTPWFESHLPPI